MRLLHGLTIAFLAAWAAVPAGAATVRLLDHPEGFLNRVSPRIAFNPDADEFLVIGSALVELRSVRSGLRGNGRGPWTVSPMRISDHWGDFARLAYNERARAYLVAGSRYLRLNGKGRVLTERRVPIFNASVYALTHLTGTRNWFALAQDATLASAYYGQIIGPRGDVLATFGLDLPQRNPYPRSAISFQVGYEPSERMLFILWDDSDGTPLGPARAIYGQRFRTDGTPVGRRTTIAKSARGASEAHMFYHPERREWFIVFRLGKNVKGRFLAGNKLSKTFRIGPRWRPGVAPSIAYSPHRDSYLVTWLQWGDGAGIYGRWLRAGGRFVGDWFAVNDPPGDQWVFEPGYSACNDTGACLVTWINDGESGTIRGQYLRVP